MKLSIENYAETGEPIILRLTHGTRVGQALSIVLGMCDDPTCGCADIDFFCQPFRQDQPPTDDQPATVFALDAWNRRVVEPESCDLTHEARALGKAVMAELDADDWQDLLAYVKLIKQEALNAIDAASLEVEFPPEVVAGDDNMVGYGEIFPHAELVAFELGDCAWVVEDHYCVDPECNCTAVALTFVGATKKRSTRKQAAEDNTPAAIYDYQGGQVEKIEIDSQSGQPAIEELLQAARAGHEAFDDEVKSRHQLLRTLFRKAMHREQVDAVPLKREEPKIGRNDPCPCGSGEKYKKCCGMMSEGGDDE